MRYKGDYNAHGRRVRCFYHACQRRLNHPSDIPESALAVPTVRTVCCRDCGEEIPELPKLPERCPKCLGSSFETVNVLQVA